MLTSDVSINVLLRNKAGFFRALPSKNGKTANYVTAKKVRSYATPFLAHG